MRTRCAMAPTPLRGASADVGTSWHGRIVETCARRHGKSQTTPDHLAPRDSRFGVKSGRMVGRDLYARPSIQHPGPPLSFRRVCTPRSRRSVRPLHNNSGESWLSRSVSSAWARSVRRTTASSSPTRAPSATVVSSRRSASTTPPRSPRSSRSTPSVPSTGSASARSRPSRSRRCSSSRATGASSRATRTPSRPCRSPSPRPPSRSTRRRSRSSSPRPRSPRRRSKRPRAEAAAETATDEA